MSYDYSERFSNWQSGNAAVKAVVTQEVDYDADPFGTTGSIPYNIHLNPLDAAAVSQKLGSRPVACGFGVSPRKPAAKSFQADRKVVTPRPSRTITNHKPVTVSAEHLNLLTVKTSKLNPDTPCLLDLAKRYAIANRHKMRKPQLVAALTGLVTLADFD